jgi:hypothetical protein
VCKQELATAMRCVAAGRELGRSWRSRRRAVGEGNRAEVGKGRRVEAVQAGGGAAAAAQRRRQGALHRWQRGGGAEQSSVCQRKKKGGGVRGVCLEISKILGTLL